MFKVVLILALAAVAFAQQPPSENPASTETEEERTAKKFIEGVCSTCHDSELITETRATKDEWTDILKNMNGKGAGLSETDVELLANYLTKNYGKPEKE
jgi:cytochrome c553